MNNEKLIEQLKRAERYYVGEISPLFREAAAEIERLEKLMEQNNSKHMEVLGKLKETNDKYNLLYAPTVKERDKLIEENDRLKEQVKELEDILVDRNDTVDTVVKLNDEYIREKIRLQERVEELEKGVKEAVHANDDLIKRNFALVTENSRKAVEVNNEVSKNARLDGKNLWLESEVKRLQAELDNLALASHSDKSFPGYETTHLTPEEVIRNDDLRDQFAIAAMGGILARMESTGSEDIIAAQAYKQADAMLKAREK